MSMLSTSAIQSPHTKKTIRLAIYTSTLTKYGAKIQYAQMPVDASLLGKADKKYIQQVCGKFYSKEGM